MAATRRSGAMALLVALALALGACTLPRLPWQDGPELAGDDVIAITRTSAGVYGYVGISRTVVSRDTVQQTYSLPNGTEIFSLTEELSPSDRERIEDAAEDYLEWERGRSDREPYVCTDVPSTRIEISGSLTHESSVQDCGDETPLPLLVQSVRSAQTELPGQLARPTSDWTVEIRPWSGDGPDESAPVERYRLTAAQPGNGMNIAAQNAPSGWGERLAPDTGEGSPLDWDATGTVLTSINDFLLAQRQMSCHDPIGEIRVIRESSPSTTWTYCLVPGEQSEALAELLRGL